MSTKITKIAEDVAQAGGFLCGNTDDPMEHIKALEAKLPCARPHLGRLSVGVPEAVALE